jgi:hypothetical protein
LEGLGEPPEMRTLDLLWRAGDGTKPFRDKIRVPGESAAEARPNPFFVNFYGPMASELARFEASEHTA